jgi:hypothetical protein
MAGRFFGLSPAVSEESPGRKRRPLPRQRWRGRRSERFAEKVLRSSQIGHMGNAGFKERHLLTSRSVGKASERLTAVVGHNSSGKSGIVAHAVFVKGRVV